MNSIFVVLYLYFSKLWGINISGNFRKEQSADVPVIYIYIYMKCLLNLFKTLQDIAFSLTSFMPTSKIMCY